MRKQSTPGRRHPRERAAVEVPYERPGEEPFQVQTESGHASRSGVDGGTLQSPGLDGIKGGPKSLAKKQIRGHHGEAAFVLK